MTRRAILHIGTEKTGTTALQHAFRNDAERLAALGVRYPDFLVPTHGALAYVAADREASVCDMGPHIGLMPGESRTAFTARLHGWLAAEVAAHPDATFVLSAGHAASRCNRALSHRREARLELAEAEIREALRLRPGTAAYWFILADILHRRGQTGLAQEAIARASAIAPDNADFRAFAAMIAG